MAVLRQTMRPWAARPCAAAGAILAAAIALPAADARGAEVTVSTAAPAAIFPISEVRAGMKGVGRTVFVGDTIEEFGVEVLAVMKRSRAQGDLILFRAEGETLAHAGIIAGMSGSPVYIDGRVVGAVAFAYPNGKDPIGAITPIGEMLEILDGGLEFPEDGAEDGPPAARSWNADPGARTSGAVSPGGAADRGSRDAFDLLWRGFLGREVERLPLPAPGATDPGALAPVQLPLTLSGWAEPLQSEMRETLGALGFSAVATPGGGSPGDIQVKPLEPGSAVAVQMVRGDADLAAIGTVTYIRGDEIVAFGHPMVQAGPVAFPMSSAWIYGVIPNNVVSVKMGGSTGLIGGILEDRRAGIGGKLGLAPDLLPVRVVMNESGAGHTYRYEVVRQTAYTPFFLPWTVSNSYLARGWGLGEADLVTTCTVYYNGDRSVTRHERIASDAPSQDLGQNVVMPASLLLVNPFEPVRIDSVAVTVDYERRIGRARLSRLSCSPLRAEVGDTLEVRVEFEPYRGPRETRVLRYPVPGAWAGRSLRLLVASTPDFMEWDSDRTPEKFNPRSLPDMIEMIERVPDDATLSVRFYAAEPGATVGGVEVSGLPPSMAAVGAKGEGASETREVSGRFLMEERIATPWVLEGGEQIEIQVER